MTRWVMIKKSMVLLTSSGEVHQVPNTSELRAHDCLSSWLEQEDELQDSVQEQLAQVRRHVE